MGGSLYDVGACFVSSALFIAITYLYERHHTRFLIYIVGVTLTMPFLFV